jgi:hypothetical protein
MPPAVASLEGRVTNSPSIANGVVAVYFSRLGGRLRAILTAVSPAKGSARHGTLEKILGVPEKQYIVGDCDYLLVLWQHRRLRRWLVGLITSIAAPDA